MAQEKRGKSEGGVSLEKKEDINNTIQCHDTPFHILFIFIIKLIFFSSTSHSIHKRHILLFSGETKIYVVLCVHICITYIFDAHLPQLSQVSFSSINTQKKNHHRLIQGNYFFAVTLFTPSMEQSKRAALNLCTCRRQTNIRGGKRGTVVKRKTVHIYRANEMNDPILLTTPPPPPPPCHQPPIHCLIIYFLLCAYIDTYLCTQLTQMPNLIKKYSSKKCVHCYV